MTAAAASRDRSSPAADEPGDRRHTEHGRERKQQLVDAAAELFADNGYAATRIQDICRRAGVAKGLFYWYFPTKQELFAELVRTMRLRLRKAQAQAMDGAADPLTRIRQGAEASVRFHAEHAGYFALLDVERADATHAELLREGSAVYLADVVALIRSAQADGLVSDEPAEALAVGVLGAVSSFTHAWRDHRIDMDAETLATFVGAWVRRALSESSAS
ncbi:MAG: TetR/AcrR family transcriptional regulator [Ilumatobacteraceae bacterium]